MVLLPLFLLLEQWPLNSVPSSAGCLASGAQPIDTAHFSIEKIVYPHLRIFLHCLFREREKERVREREKHKRGID